MLRFIARVLNLLHIPSGTRMSEEQERRDYADREIHARFVQMLADMVQEEVIDPDDAERAMRKINWDLPAPVTNEEFIELVAKLQQKEGEAQETKIEPLSSLR